MKRFFISLALAAVTGIAGAQGLSSIEFLSNLDEKSNATIADAVALFAFTLNGKSAGYDADAASLQKKGIIKKDEFAKNDPLSRGDLSLMIARWKNLRSSLLYNITGLGRYAYKACAAEGYMPKGKSEFDTLSGQELIEALSQKDSQKERSE